MDFAASEEALSSLGLRDLRRIMGGWQSLAVYDARSDGRHVAVKVFDPDLVDRTHLDVRLAALSMLATTTGLVCAPVVVGGRRVNEVADVWVVAYEFAEGEAPDITDPEHGAQMGRALAELHAAMATLPPLDLPPLRAFPGLPDGPRQLLHGDLSSKNVRFAGATWRVFDFDDCGYGPVDLDLASSLYFVLFDALTGPDPGRYRRFRDGFLGGYRSRGGVVPADDVLDGLITGRVSTLASWLADLDTAPAGIRTASPEWHRTLHGFVDRYRATVD